jgi:endonuclease YncB( thermonuclease family)
MDSLAAHLKSHADTPYFTFKGKELVAYPVSVYDGDTFSAIFDYNGEAMKYRCRCYGYDSPEMKPSLKNENRDEEKRMALQAKHQLSEYLNKHSSGLVRMECLDFDKYGRILVNVWNMVDEESVNDLMIRGNHGVPYFGGKKDKF